MLVFFAISRAELWRIRDVFVAAFCDLLLSFQACDDAPAERTCSLSGDCFNVFLLQCIVCAIMRRRVRTDVD